VASVGIICDRELLKPMDQRVWKQATSIKKMGYDVEIITPHPQNLYKNDAKN